jgi:hypothetical protein|tara:strand:+ start:3462 stop:3995 length:534 start_codon:yes stop_codon:yes gene_type:complete
MATITLRAAKGSPLTNNEVDGNFTNLNTDKYESGSNIAAGTLAATGAFTGTTAALSSNISVAGSSTLSTSATVSAAGTDQAAATGLTSTYNIVTTATANQGVKLPDTAAGLEITILNDSANTIKIYPTTGESIDAGATNASVDLASGHSLKLVGVAATKWNRLVPVVVYDASGTRVN